MIRSLLLILSLIPGAYAQDQAEQIAVIQEKWARQDVQEVTVVLGSPDSPFVLNPSQEIEAAQGFSSKKSSPVILLDFNVRAIRGPQGKNFGGFFPDHLMCNLAGISTKRNRSPETSRKFVIISSKTLDNTVQEAAQRWMNVIESNNISSKEVVGYGNPKRATFMTSQQPVNALFDLIQLESITKVYINVLDSLDHNDDLKLIELLERLSKTKSQNLQVTVKIHPRLEEKRTSLRTFLLTSNLMDLLYPFAKIEIYADLKHVYTEDRYMVTADKKKLNHFSSLTNPSSRDYLNWQEETVMHMTESERSNLAAEGEDLIAKINLIRRKVDLQALGQHMNLDAATLRVIGESSGFSNFDASERLYLKTRFNLSDGELQAVSRELSSLSKAGKDIIARNEGETSRWKEAFKERIRVAR